jgi:hypothetical protein
MDPLVGIRHRHPQGRSESACFNTRCMYETELSLMIVGVSTQDIWSLTYLRLFDDRAYRPAALRPASSNLQLIQSRQRHRHSQPK